LKRERYTSNDAYTTHRKESITIKLRTPQNRAYLFSMAASFLDTYCAEKNETVKNINKGKTRKISMNITVQCGTLNIIHFLVW
jgi:hypothetical protein